MPKADGGVRVLHALGKRGGRRPRKAPGAATLADVALVLKLEAKRDPARVGFGGGGPDALWRCLRRLRCDGSPSRDLAGLQLDVKGCFDAIDGAGKGCDSGQLHRLLVFHSFRLIVRRAIISRSGLERACLSLERARARNGHV